MDITMNIIYDGLSELSKRSEVSQNENQNKIKELEAIVKAQKEKIEYLKSKIKYLPNGEGYQEALSEFTHYASQQK